MFLGSSEDGFPDPDLGIAEGKPLPLSAGDAILAGLARLALSAVFGLDFTVVTPGHGEKPVICTPGYTEPPLVPNAVPVHIIMIGSFALLGVPGEFTTMSGRRLMETVKNELGLGYEVAIAGYANEYS